ncbi:MAG: hypothetical protein KC546_16845, partial [Anaerolineae bacterium]|nr:hypothetical protein [Anaerolineae bacterium]
MPAPINASKFTFVSNSVTLNLLFLVEGLSGLLLDIVLAAFLGATSASDVLYGAWLIPQSIGRGVFQSLTNSYLGLFNDTLDRNQSYQQALTLALICAVPLSLLIALTGRLWIPGALPGLTQESQRMAMQLTVYLAWIIVFAAIIETNRALFYVFGNMMAPSFIRAASVLVAILSLAMFGSTGNLGIISLIIVGAFFMEAIAGIIFLRSRYGMQISLVRPREVGQQIRVVGVPIFGQTLRAVAGMVVRALATLLAPGVLTVLVYSERILFTLERFIFRGFVINVIRDNGERTSNREKIRVLVLVAIPLALLLIFEGEPLASLLFSRGSFSGSDSTLLGASLAGYGPAILTLALTPIPFGIAYSRQDSFG